MWWGLGQAEESEEGECACVDNPSRNRFMLTGRKREKQPTAGTTRQEAGIPALLPVLCNLKLWAPGPQAFQIIMTRSWTRWPAGTLWAGTTCRKSLSQEGPPVPGKRQLFKGRDKEPQSPGWRKRHPGTLSITASVRPGLQSQGSHLPPVGHLHL